MVVLSCQGVELVPQRAAEAVSREGDLLAAVLVLNIGDGMRRGVEGGLGVAIVFGVEGEAVEFALDIVSQDSHLAEPAVEGFGGGDVGDITEAEDIIVSLVLEGGGFDVEEAGGIGETGFSENRVSGGGDERVEVAIVPFDQLTGLVVLEHCHVVALSHFYLTLLTSTSVRLFSMLIP